MYLAQIWLTQYDPGNWLSLLPRFIIIHLISLYGNSENWVNCQSTFMCICFCERKATDLEKHTISWSSTLANLTVVHQFWETVQFCASFYSCGYYGFMSEVVWMVFPDLLSPPPDTSQALKILFWKLLTPTIIHIVCIQSYWFPSSRKEAAHQSTQCITGWPQAN